MKKLYFSLIIGFLLSMFCCNEATAQTATTTVYYTGFQACGGCAVCGADYWCTNTPGSYCGNTAPCIAKTFFDPVPAGHVVTSVTVNYYTASCEGAAFVASINSFAVPMAYDGNTGCWCDDNPCMMTTSVSSTYPCGMPGYNYGGNNTFNLCSYGPMCINRAVLIFTYVDPDVITPNITASGPLTFCTGGSVVLNAGTGYSSYTWNTGATSQTITATTSGTYSVTVSSTTGCTTGSSSVVVTVTPYVTPTFTQLGPYCMGATPGVLPTTSNNGIIGTWSPASISTASVGTTVYTFTPNAGSCAGTTTMSVTVNPSPAPTFNQLGPYCAGTTPGTLPTTSTNGVTGSWSPATINTGTPGTVTHTFTPNAGQCASTATMNITVFQNPSLTAVIHGNPSCHGSTDGSIVVGVSGGTAPYAFLWNNSATTQDLYDAPAGSYSVTVTDFNGCTGTASASLVEPDEVVTSVVSVTPSICNTPGSATVNATGGNPPFTYTWPAAAGGVTGATAGNLAAGSYMVTASDALLCSATVTVNVPSTGSVSAGVNSVSHVSCYGYNDGSINLGFSLGTPPYSVNWGSGSSSTSNSSINIPGLAAGTYTISVTDGNGCETTVSGVVINEPAPIQASISSITHVTCNGGSDGAAVIAVSGGSSPYSYTWSAAGLSGPNATGLSAGNYSVTISDQNSCTAELSFQIQENSNFIVDIETENALCYGLDGIATVSVVGGGQPPYSIIWEDAITLFTHTQVPVNTNFGFTITDNLGCSYNNVVTVSQPDELSTSITGTDATCGGSNTGSATASINGGGTPPYFYNWSNGSPNPSIGYLAAGSYSVTITDFNGCSNVHTVTIAEPPILALTISTSPIVCGSEAGSALATATGGTPPYTYLWSDGTIGQEAVNLNNGTYLCTVTDQNLCTGSNSGIVAVTGNLTPQISVLGNISCYGDTNGALTVNTPGAHEPYWQQWSNNMTQPSISNLAAGNYSVTVTDSWGCTGSTVGTITGPDALVGVATITHVRCKGGSDGAVALIVSGGTPPYNYNWSNNSHTPVISNLGIGNYAIVITDSNNCQVSYNYTINEPPYGLSVHGDIGHVSCYGGNDGSITIVAGGGTPPFTYTCSNQGSQISSQNVSGLPAGSYQLSVVDSYGCTGDTTVLVTQPAPLELVFDFVNPSCYGNNDGSVDFIVSGGTAPYWYKWQNTIIDLPYFDGLIEGSYTFVIIDDNGCELSVGPIQLEDDKKQCIKIPNAFTPNADGINDTWVIENIDRYPAALVQVFNRWGQIIYDSNYTTGDWDGYYNGKLMPTGAYLYVINLFNGTNTYTGVVSLVK